RRQRPAWNESHARYRGNRLLCRPEPIERAIRSTCDLSTGDRGDASPSTAPPPELSADLSLLFTPGRIATTPRLTRRGQSRISPATLSRHSAAGKILGVLPGTYLRADVATDPAWRTAAVAAWRPDAIVVGAAAAAQTFWREVPVTQID